MRGLILVGLLSASGCRVHLGVAPPVARFADVAVEAPVTDEELGEALRAAVGAELVARGAREAGAPTLRVVVEDAALTPFQRLSGGLVYRVALTAELRCADARRRVTITREVADPGSAGDAARLRPDALRAAAADLAAVGVAWAVAEPGCAGAAGPPPESD